MARRCAAQGRASVYDITIQQIEAFLTVGHYLNVSKAAEALFVSQPTLSKMLRRFETNIGFPLFSRSTQGVRLTPQGKYLLDALDPLYSNLEHVISAARKVGVSTSHTLQIVVPSSYNMVEDYRPLWNCFDVFRETHPEIHLRKHLCDLPELQWQFSFGSADLIIAPDFALKQSDLMGVRVIGGYTSCIAVSGPAPDPELSLAEVVGGREIFVAAEGDNAGAKARLRRLCQCNGISSPRLTTVDNHLTLVERLSEGDCAVILPRVQRAFTGPLVTYYPLKPLDKPLRIVAVWRKDRLSPQLRILLKELPELSDKSPAAGQDV